MIRARPPRVTLSAKEWLTPGSVTRETEGSTRCSAATRRSAATQFAARSSRFGPCRSTSGSVLSDMLQLSNSVGALYSAAKEDDLGEEGDEEYDFVEGLVKELAEYGISVDFDKLRARVEAEQKQ